MIEQQRSKRRVAAGSVLGLVLTGAIFAGCSSNGGASLEVHACQQVHRSLSLYATASKETGAKASHDLATALTLLRSALRPAALAAADSSDFQALAATLSESSRVKEALLIPALTAQCSPS